MGARNENPEDTGADASFLSSDSDGEEDDEREVGAFTPTMEAADDGSAGPALVTVEYGTQTAGDTIDPRDGEAEIADVGIQTTISGLSMDLNVREGEHRDSSLS